MGFILVVLNMTFYSSRNIENYDFFMMSSLRFSEFIEKRNTLKAHLQLLSLHDHGYACRHRKHPTPLPLSPSSPSPPYSPRRLTKLMMLL